MLTTLLLARYLEHLNDNWAEDFRVPPSQNGKTKARISCTGYLSLQHTYVAVEHGNCTMIPIIIWRNDWKPARYSIYIYICIGTMYKYSNLATEVQLDIWGGFVFVSVVSQNKAMPLSRFSRWGPNYKVILQFSQISSEHTRTYVSCFTTLD